MTQPNLPNTAAEHRTDRAPSRNGNGSDLSDRVRSLRLSEKTQSGGGSRSTVIPWTACLLLVVMTAAFGYRAYMIKPTVVAADSQAQPDSAANSTPGGAGGASTATNKEVALEVKGFVTPLHQIQVSPKVGGELQYLDPKFEEGAFFKKDQVLARIENVDYKTDFDHTKAMLVSAEKDLQVEEANFEQLKRAYERTAALVGTAAASQNDYDLAYYNFQAQEKRVNKLKASIDVAKADLVKMKWRLENVEIKAPVDGTILTKAAEKGNLVNPSAFSNGLSASLCDMADLTEMEVEVMVQQRDRPHVFVGQKCDVMPEAFQNDDKFKATHPRGYEGVVSRIMPKADRSKNAIPVRVKVIFPEAEVTRYHEKGEWGWYLIPDMGAIVKFKKKQGAESGE